MSSNAIPEVSCPLLAPQPGTSSATQRAVSPDWSAIAAIVSAQTQPPWPPPCTNAKSVILVLSLLALDEIAGNAGIGEQPVDPACLVEALVGDELQLGRVF